MIAVWIGVTVVFVALELLGEVQDSKTLVWVAKPIASTGFVLAGVESGALETPYGQAVFVGLCLCWLGDVLLIPKDSKRSFLLGLVSFLLGHVAYAYAFTIAGVDLRIVAVASLVLAVPVGIVGRWLLPNVSGPMTVPVLAYMTVITVMVTLAAGTMSPILIAAATLFYVSDLAVARQRFVVKAHVNRLVGLPLYFAAQIIFAVTV